MAVTRSDYQRAARKIGTRLRPDLTAEEIANLVPDLASLHPEAPLSPREKANTRKLDQEIDIEAPSFEDRGLA